ncbi:MAG TPA: ATP-dependent helicase [Clostridiaceae bacterium]|nr:ATP-dependent helicase [Clostridiaceae bacterium]
MNFIELIDKKYGIKLNEQQKQAVKHVNGPALVLSGPGSGKTTVIAARTAYLVMETGVNPESIMTLTFNRAARYEMEHRFSKVFGSEIDKKAYFSTFHSFCNLLVRHYEKRQGRRFKRIEGNEDLSSKREILKNIYLQINESNINDDQLEDLINEISLVKNKMLKDLDGINFKTRNFVRIFNAFEEYKRANLLMDFDDMLTYAYAILNKCPDILMYYKNRYKYIQVDEGQDLSKIQFEILKMLVGPKDCNLFIVADDDQSIYGFRGAEPQYILEIEQQFEGCRLYRLEKNYRSTRNIVDVSSEFIKRNHKRYDKNHRTDNNFKSDPFIISAKDETDQQNLIIKIIKEKLEDDENMDIAVLFRNNLSSVAIIDALDRNGIHFRVRQNRLDFFDHWLVQDILAFMRFALDQTDVEAFMRIYYKMNRFISKAMMEYAVTAGYKESVIDVILKFDGLQPYQRKTMIELKIEFKRLAGWNPVKVLDYIENSFRYFDGIREYCEMTGLSIDYLYGLFGILMTIARRCESVPSFLERMVELKSIIESSGDGESEGYITLTTLHSSKGLEYDCVIMADLNNTEIPGQYALGKFRKDNDASLIEEERRLFYVGMTRARKYLYLLWPQVRNGFKEPKSLFIDEVEECLNKKAQGQVRAGMIVQHRKFGRGIINALYRQDDGNMLIEIDFGGILRKLDFKTCIENRLLDFQL